MSVTLNQRIMRSGQPYTRIARVASPKVIAQLDGLPTVELEYKWNVYGYVLEEKLVAKDEDDSEDPEWSPEWEETLIDQVATLDEAYAVADGWRASLVGVYPIR